jgi:chlorite dismutase
MADPVNERAEPERRSLQHFGVYALTPAYWALADHEQLTLQRDWARRLCETARAVHHYRTYPTTTRSDILVWCALDATDPAAPERFFDAYTRVTRDFRRYLQGVDVLWGFTRASEYSRARSRQEIDPFEPRVLPYLVMYPFTKTADWYLMNHDARQGMMNEHMRIGKQYKEISQLLVYSIGLQDHEFVVVYETADLALFSRLVHDLRQTEARRFTRRDTPVHTALHRPLGGATDLWP